MRRLLICFSLLVCVGLSGRNQERTPEQIRDREIAIPYEMVGLHFDNTSYFEGDRIWFKCYLVLADSEDSRLSELSKTLYVELLNPGGVIVSRKVLKVENGVCDGSFTLNHTPFYSGFYEVRAYTKFMLNFGDDAIFSRLLPVYDNPKVAGDFSDKKMLSYQRAYYTYPNKRGSLLKESAPEPEVVPVPGIDSIIITSLTGNSSYRPFEPVEMEFLVTDSEGNPQPNTTFSLAVRDAAGEVVSDRNILTELFRVSADAPLELDMSDIKYLAEQGIEATGRVVTDAWFSNEEKPKAGVDVGFYIEKGVGADTLSVALESAVTDSLGRFSFVSNINGRYKMSLAVTENGRPKDYRIRLDRIFSPPPRKYSYSDLEVSIASDEPEPLIDNLGDVESDNEFSQAYIDSLVRVGIDQDVHNIEEVRIRGRRRTHEDDVRRNRTTSVAYYDAQAELADIYDQGGYVGDDIYAILQNMNKEFEVRYVPKTPKPEEDPEGTPDSLTGPYFLYKGRYVWFCINHVDGYRSKDLPRIPAPAENIQSIYINESPELIEQYVHYIPPFDITASSVPVWLRQLLRVGSPKNHSCVVFIETDPDALADGGKGTRRTSLEGYTPSEEFKSPDYSVLPPYEEDYRRTLYWNPDVTTDENGRARVRFYNNSRTRHFRISAETVTPDGKAVVYMK